MLDVQRINLKAEPGKRLNNGQGKEDQKQG
jgi:hypothetical protein